MGILTSTTALTIAKDKRGKHVYLYKGQTVDGAALDADDSRRLIKAGWLREETAEQTEQAPSSPRPGSAQAILTEVGDDVEKAKAALAAEQAKGDKARKNVVEPLEALIAKAAGAGTGEDPDGGAS